MYPGNLLEAIHWLKLIFQPHILIRLSVFPHIAHQPHNNMSYDEHRWRRNLQYHENFRFQKSLRLASETYRREPRIVTQVAIDQKERHAPDCCFLFNLFLKGLFEVL
jgi:hypothetical protein